MSIIENNSETCNKCGVCADECPRRIISLAEGAFPETAAEATCNECGHCVAVCPMGSLSNRCSPLGKSPKMEETLRVTVAQVEQLLKGRRSARVFREKAVPRETITQLIEVARYAPTGHNAQEVEWLVIDGKEELERVEDLGTAWLEWVIKSMPQEAASSNLETRLARQKLNRNTLLRGAPALIVTHAPKASPASLAGIDCATALAFLDLAANSRGLATCWAGYVYMMANTFPPLREFLKLPADHAAYGCVMLGYNKFKYHRIPVRKEPKITWR